MPFPEAVFLDVGWTLAYPRESLWSVLASVIGRAGGSWEAGEVERRVHALMTARRAREIETFGPDARYEDSDEAFRGMFMALGRWVFGSAGIASDHDAWTEQALGRFWDMDNWALFPDAVPAVLSLRRAGARVLALSNASSELVEFLDRIGLAPHLDGALVSAVEGVRKPDARLFERALERAGVPARNAVHVGDMFLEDVLGARGAGIRPFLIDRTPRGMFPSYPETAAESIGRGPVETVRTLDDVIAALQGP